MSFVMPQRNGRMAPCRERDCGHASCDRLRMIAASPCLLCRHVIGWGLAILDERTDAQKEAEVYYVGFVHENCRKRWKAKYQPGPRDRRPPKHKVSAPIKPTPVHVNTPLTSETNQPDTPDTSEDGTT